MSDHSTTSDNMSDRPKVFSNTIGSFPFGMFFASVMSFDSYGIYGWKTDAMTWCVFFGNILLTPLYIAGSLICQIGYVLTYPLRWVIHNIRK